MVQYPEEENTETSCTLTCNIPDGVLPYDTLMNGSIYVNNNDAATISTSNILTTKQREIEFEVRDDGIYRLIPEYYDTYRIEKIMSKEAFIEAFNKYIKEEN